MLAWLIWGTCWITFLFGALVCISNIWHALRYSIHKAQGKSEESYQHVSGIPALGSGLVALSLIKLHDTPGMLVVGILFFLLDPMGILWFMIMMIYFMCVRATGKE